MKIALAILTWDELEGITELWPQIDKTLFDEIIAVDPGSTDGTLEFYEENNIKCIIQKERGRGNAFREAFNYLQSDAVVFFSGDGNEDPSDLPKMIEYLREGNDLVIGGRFIRKGCASDNSDDALRIRWVGNVIISLLCRVIWRTGVFDSINGYRGFTKDAFYKLNLDAPAHEIELQSTIRASKLKLKIKEFATKELHRIGNPRKKSAGTFILARKLGKTVLREIWIRKRFVVKD